MNMEACNRNTAPKLQAFISKVNIHAIQCLTISMLQPERITVARVCNLFDVCELGA
jgi:hypothetical protein